MPGSLGILPLPSYTILETREKEGAKLVRRISRLTVAFVLALMYTTILASAYSEAEDGAYRRKVSKTGEATRAGRETQPARGADDGEGTNWRRVGSTVVDQGSTTKIKVVRDSIFVPVTVTYGRNQVDVMLILDTGANKTSISAEVAEGLNINLSETRKARIQVVGGAVLNAHRVVVNDISIGPHSRKNVEIVIVEHRGPPVRYDGLLGMDLLRAWKYNLDLDEQVIIWQ